MIVDASEFEPGSTLETDVCIIGAGAAGITIAREFLDSRSQVCVLEGGSVTADAASQSFYTSIRNVGRDFPSLNASRTRCFGGSTNCWTGNCMPLRTINLEKLPWSRYTGWPISMADLRAYYPRAEAILGLAGTDCDATEVAVRLGQALIPFDPASIETFVSRYNPIRFGQVFRQELAEAPNVKVVLDANATSIEAREDGASIERVAVRTLGGRQASVRARTYILATGGIENARLLLASRSIHRGGLGNQHDLVGRFFMSHIWYTSGLIVGADPQASLDLYVREQPLGKVACRAHLALPESVVRSGGVPDFRADLRGSYLLRHSKAVRSAQSLRASLSHFEWPQDIGAHLANIMEHPGDVVSAASGESGPPIYVLQNIVEQAPNPDSRIGLASQWDALGMPLATIDWRLSEVDKAGVRFAHEHIAREVGRSGFGRMLIELPEQEVEPLAGADGGGHHMGTTRMHDSPRLGVVDRNCRVHGIANLYVAGSSVFPTSGFANPTFTIIALAVRLSDHVKGGLNA